LAAGEETYYPLVAGSSWTYQVTVKVGDEVKKSQVTRKAVGVDVAGQTAIVTGLHAEAVKDDAVYAVGATRLATNADPGGIEPLKEPFKVLPLRPKVGDKWQRSTDDGAVSSTCLGFEKVKTEAGDFEAAKVYTIRVGGKDRSDRVETNQWYAPGVGLVKSVMTSRWIRDGKVNAEERTEELVSYDIPKAGGPTVVKGVEHGAGKPMDENSVGVLFAEGEALARRGEHAAAIAKYDAALAIDPKAAKLHAYKAISLMASKDYDAAQRSIDAALRLNDREHTYQEIAGQLKVAQGHVDEGMRLYEKAATLSPRSAGAVYMDLAAVLAAKNDPRLSAEIDRALKRAADADPPSLEALFALGQSYVNAGRIEGKEYLRRYIDGATRLPPEQRDERKITLAKQLIRAIEAVKGL
jgi:Tfp pilus assembly protein PilF